MMRASILLVIAFVVFSFAQNSPPLLNGSWTSACSLVPNSDQIYVRRTVVLGVWDEETQSGTWSYTVNAFNSIECDINFQYYRTIYTGTYALTGKKADNVPLFWNIDYRFNAKTMEVFTNEFADYIRDEPGCDIQNIVPQTIMSIRHTNCETLQIVPIEHCPILHDIVRRSGNTLWVGNQFPGDPVHWASNCQTEDRPKFADEYSFTLSTAPSGYDYGIDLDAYFTDSDSTFGTSDFKPDDSDFGISGYGVDEEEDSSSSVVIQVGAVLLAFATVLAL